MSEPSLEALISEARRGPRELTMAERAQNYERSNRFWDRWALELRAELNVIANGSRRRA